jgi:predicted DNA-binding protein YlxM (UPF0122 family)
MSDNGLDLYVLCDYDFTLSSLKKLIQEGFTWSDFVNYSERLQTLNIQKPTTVAKILKIVPNVDENKRKDNLYQLAHEGLSYRNIKTLMDLGLEYKDLSVLTLDQLSSLLGGNRKSLFIKVKQAYENIESLKGNSSISLFENCMQELIDSLLPREVITYQSLIEKIERDLPNENVEMELVEDFVEKNLKNGLLNEVEKGFAKNYKTIEELFAEEFRNKEVLIMRMNGMSLQEIANVSGVTRQAVANKEGRLLNRLEELEEFILYKDLFESYDWNQQLFCDLFDEPIEVYQLLGLKFRRGNKNPLELLDEENSLSEVQVNTLLNSCGSFITHSGQIKPLNKTTIFEEVIYHYGREATNDEEIVEKFNNYLIENGLDERFKVDRMSVRSISERSPVLIRSKSHYYRYFNYDEIDTQIKSRLEELLDLTPGVYNMVKIFIENKDFMEELDVRSEHELHNLYKRMIELDGVTYNRMPEFSVGNIHKNEFLIRLFYEQAPILIEEFALYVEENYGLRVNSLISHIHMFLADYVHGDFIKVNHHELDDSELIKFKSLIGEDIYTVEQLNKIGNVIDPEFHDKFLNNMILSKLGYSLKGKYVLNNKYESVNAYFIEHILSHDYFLRDRIEIYNSSLFTSVLYELEKDLKVVKLEKDLYITSKKLEEARVPRNILIGFRERVLGMVNDNEFFTLHRLRTNNDFSHDIEDLGFEDFFYDRIVWTSDLVRTIPLASGCIFIKNDTDVSLIDFIRYLVERDKIINIYEMQDYVKEHYGILLDLSRVLSLVKDTGIYYSEDLSRLYIDKNTYFEEIY